MQRDEIPRSPSGFSLIITVFDTANLNHKRGFHVMPGYNRRRVATWIQLEAVRVAYNTPRRN